MTTELIAALNTSGFFSVLTQQTAYTLEVNILSNQQDRIGYRRDPQKINDQIHKNLLGCEDRLSLSADVTLYHTPNHTIASGPHRITCDVDYDYVDGDSYPDLTFQTTSGQTTVVLPFSLGQLESIEAAQEASLRPLYRKFSQKIVDAISSEW